MRQLLSLFFILCSALAVSSAPNNPILTPGADPVGAEFNCNLPAPTGLIVTGTTTSSISTQWNAVPGAMAYRVQAIRISNGQMDYQNVTNSTTETCVGLASATQYEIRVTPVCTGGIISLNQARVAASTDIIIDLVINGYQSCPADWNSHTAGSTTVDCTIELDKQYIGELAAPGEAITHRFRFWVSLQDQSKTCYFESDESMGVVTLNSATYQLSFITEEHVLAANMKFFSDQLQATTVIGRVTNLENGYTFKWGKCQDKEGGSGREAPSSTLVQSNELARVSPNPFGDVLQYQTFPTTENQMIEMVLMTTAGTVVKQWTCGGSNNTNGQIPTTDLPAGMYILSAQSDEKTETKLLVKHN